MAFKDPYGITDIPTAYKRERISISYDTHDYDFVKINDPNTFAVILYVPNKKDHHHDHIELTDKAAEKLRDWLTEYLKAKGK